jgi:hypothetical protein
MKPNERPCTIAGDVDLRTYTLVLQRLQALLEASADEVAPGVPLRGIVQERTQERAQ